MVNLKGFRDLVDAVGGVTLNVRQRIPIGGLGTDVYDYIEPGRQKLTGFQTQWYARARDGSDDYSRMARQKCVMNAMLHQVSPQTVLTHFEQIAKASSQMISTDIPASEVDRFMARVSMGYPSSAGEVAMLRAHEVSDRSGVRVRLESERFPAIDGALDLARHGVRTSGDPRNRDFAGPHLQLNGVPDAFVSLGYDPQTAGGLLVSLPSERGASLEAEFASSKLFVRRIGRVEEGAGVVVE